MTGHAPSCPVITAHPVIPGLTRNPSAHLTAVEKGWIPACAGMTELVVTGVVVSTS